MPKVVRKKRVFEDTDNIIDNVNALDIETFNLFYTDSDAPNDKLSNSKSNVPKPKEDSNKLDPIIKPPNNSGNGDDSGDGQEEQQNSQQSGQQMPQQGSQQSGGSQQNGQQSDSQQSGQQNNTDNQQGSQQSGQQSGSQQGSQQSNTNNQQSSTNNQQNNSQQGNQQSSTGSNQQSNQQSDNQQGNNSNKSKESTFNGDSLKEAIDKIRESLTKTQKEYDKENIDGEAEEKLKGTKGNNTKLGDTVSDKAEKETLEKLLKESNAELSKEESKNNNSNSNEHKQERLSEVYDQMSGEMVSSNKVLNSTGMGSLIRIRDTQAAKSWEISLKRALKKALGTTISYNPNLINKRIPDAPPGKETSKRAMKEIIVLLDCSASMGASKFKKALLSINEFLTSSRKELKKVDITVYSWGSSNIKDVQSSKMKLNINNFKRILTLDSYMPTTVISPVLEVIKRKARTADLIIILTDAEIFDYDNLASYKSLLTNNRNKILWIVTQDYNKEVLLEIDKTAYKDSRIIRLTK